MGDDPVDRLTPPAAPVRISCLMPTRGRHHLLPRALQCFLAQDVADAELVIVSEDGVPDTLAAALAGGRVRHVPCPPGLTLGAKRNLACRAARGDILVHWDDDDWQSPQRLQRQLAALEQPGVRLCGSGRVYFHELDGHRAWLYQYRGPRRPWVYGATLAFRRSYWQDHPFPDLAVGEDNAFVWAANPGEVRDLDDPTLCVATVHPGNTSPKDTGNAWWQPVTLPPELAAACRGDAPGPLRNVYACLVHERPDCVIDLVRNLRHLDADSPILLYDGSPHGRLLDARLPWARWGAELVPRPRPMAWGQLHGFALDCLRHLRDSGRDYDVLTNVDSDQLALRAGYPRHLAGRLGDRRGLGLLSGEPAHQGPATRIPPAATAQQEIEHWRPWLHGFPDGERHWVHWTFWPQTVITREAGEALVERFDGDTLLERTLAGSRLWATEEVLLPTLVRLLGFRIERNPCSARWVQYRVAYDTAQVRAALACPDACWMHPVPRRYDDPIRVQVRRHHGDYRCAGPRAPSPPGETAMLATMRGIEGWLADDEAALLHRLATALPARAGDGSAAPTLVEVGSYCGKATFVLADALRRAGTAGRVVAIDRFDGVLGAADRPAPRQAPSLEKFRRTLQGTGIAPWVETVVGGAAEQAWDRPVDLLLLDGLHDYASLVQDLAAFDACMAPGALLALHDCADYFPDVGILADELIASGLWAEHAWAGTLRVLVRRAAQAADGVRPSRAATPATDADGPVVPVVPVVAAPPGVIRTGTP